MLSATRLRNTNEAVAALDERVGHLEARMDRIEAMLALILAKLGESSVFPT